MTNARRRPPPPRSTGTRAHILPRRIAGASLLIVAAPLAACAGAESEAASVPSVKELVEAELAFAASAAEKGTSAAFLQYLDVDGVIFQPGAVSGREWHTTVQSPVGAVLAWQPRIAAVSASGELGFTTGPWSYRASAAAAPSAYGDYVSIWRRRSNQWRLAVDIGIQHDPPSTDFDATSTATMFMLGPPPETGSNAALISVRDAELALQGRLAAGQPVVEMLASNVHVLRDRAFPDSGRAVFDILPRPAAVLRWTTQGSGESHAGDLGYTYGTFGADAGDASDAITGNFLRIWTRDDAGGWVIALDLLNLHPPPPIASAR